jgi:5-formaminoimidazole-4-carboxamide-1-beta-D-ribofuranosyl 5'-monophosphate synthetase
MWHVFVDDTDVPEHIGTFASESAAQACADAYPHGFDMIYVMHENHMKVLRHY